MVKIAYTIVRDRHAAEDVVQAAFVKAFTAWWRVSRADDPVAYTRRIVVNAALAHLRKPVQRFEYSLAEVPDRSVVHPDVARSGQEDIWDLLGQLPPRRGAIVVLRHFEALTEREIADVLGCRPGTVKSQASAALRSLRDQLGTHDAERGAGRGHRS